MNLSQQQLVRQKLDFIIGLFVICAAAGVVFIALQAANITDVSDSEGYVLNLRFDNIGTLRERALVKSSGVTVGRVKSIHYDTDEFNARVEVIIEDTYRFPADSIFSIVSSSLLGGQYISIDVGGDDVMLEANDELTGNSALILEELIGKFLFDKAGE